MNVSKIDLLNYYNYAHKDYLNYISYLHNMLIKFIKGKYNFGKNTRFNHDFDHLLIIAKKLNTDVIPYSAIAKIVYRIYDKYAPVDGIEIFCNRCNKLIKNRLDEEKGPKVSSGFEILLKTIENIKLSSSQMNAFYASKKSSSKNLDNLFSGINILRNGIKKASNDCNTVSSSLNKFMPALNNTKEQFNKSEKNWNKRWKKINKVINTFESKVYGRIISVLGIFITIAIAMFGGLGAISSSIKALTNSNVNIFSIILLSILFSLVLLLVIFFLFVCISKLTNNNIKQSQSYDPFKKYPIFSFSITVLGLLFIITLIFKHIFN